MLRFYARYKQNTKNVQGTIGSPIRYDMQAGSVVTANATIVQNNAVQTHPSGFPVYPDWYEFTGDIINGAGVKIKAGGRDKDGEAKRLLYTDSDIEVEGEMVRFVSFHLINTPASKYNAIEVRITDDSCGEIFTFPTFVITNDDLTFEVCDNDSICKLSFNITEDELYKTCLESTLIDVSPNAAGNSYFGNGTIHPRFRVGYDRGSEALYIIFTILLTAILPIGVFLTSVTYRWVFRVGFRKIAPFVRTYLQNACEHCGLNLASTTFERGSNIVGSQEDSEPRRGLGSIFGAANSPYRNLTLMYDSTDNDIKEGSTTSWIDGISPLVLAKDFLDKLKQVFNAKWEIYGNTLFFHRKDALIFATPVLDLVSNDIHKSWLSDCIDLSTISERKSPKYLEVKFGEDAELRGADMKSSYNRIANFGFTNYSSSFGGSTQIVLSDFTMTQTTTDFKKSNYESGYIRETIFWGGLPAIPFVAGVIWYNTDSESSQTSSLIVLSEKAWNGWKLIDYDTNTPMLDGEAKFILPQPYVPYNPTLRAYQMLGNPLLPNPTDRPTYQNRNAIMHFDSEYTDNLFYYFWYIEDEVRFPKRSERATIKLTLCCETLRKLGVNSPNRASIGFLVLIPINGQSVKFTIEEIELDYDKRIITLGCDVYRFNNSNI